MTARPSPVAATDLPQRDRSGAYGFCLEGLRAARSLLVRAPTHWPRLAIEVRVTTQPPPVRERFDRNAAIVRLRGGGWVTLYRAAGCAVFHMRTRPPDAAMIHPHLAAPAVVASHWLGRESFHAGAFVLDGAAWGVLGDRGAGKSSLLASLAREGVPVVADDVLVLDGPAALAGPRSIDLRADAAAELGVGECLGVIGQRERWRVPLEVVAPEVPLRGWVTLAWAERIAVRPARGSQRLEALLANRAVRLPPSDPAALIELSALPVLELRRPRRWGSEADALGRLCEAVAG